MANTGLVGIFTADDKWAMSNTTKTTGHPQPSTQARSNSSTNKNALRGFSIIRQALQCQGVPREAEDVIITAWRDSTKRQYNCYIQQWVLFCGRHRNPIKPTVNDMLAYLGSIHQKGLKFSAFQTARAAINNFVRICGGSDFFSHFLTKKFMQGIFNMKPSLPKYDSVWDVQLVLRYIEKMDKLTLLELSAKLCMLFLLVTAQRCQTLHLIEIEDIEMKDNIYVIKTRHKLKQTRPGYHLKDIILQPYDKPKLCIVKTLKEYLIRTEGFRIDEKKLLISTLTPHKGVSKTTVSRWVKQLMLKAENTSCGYLYSKDERGA